MLLCMVCFSTLLIQRSKCANALNAMFVETVDTQVFVALKQYPIQSTMRCENSTLLCIKWPLTLILNQFSIYKKFWKAETEGFSTIPPILSILYMSILSIQDKDL